MMIRLRRWQRPGAALLLLLFLPSCVTRQVAGPTPAAYLQREHPSWAKVTRTNGVEFKIRAPVVIADTLRGTLYEDSRTPVVVPMNEIQRVEVERFSTGRTLGLIGLSLVVLGLIVAGSGGIGWGGTGNWGTS